MDLKFQVVARVARPVAEVFDAVYNPDKLKGYFTTAGASAPLDPGTTVTWEFADFPGPFPIQVLEVVPERAITFTWPAAKGGTDTRVEMEFEPLDAVSTMVRIRESGWHPTQDGLDASYDNCSGWTQMAACLKLYCEEGRNFRDGYFM
jgi:uncharacterized protein YndB with AHSA1/START domain